MCVVHNIVSTFQSNGSFSFKWLGVCLDWYTDENTMVLYEQLINERMQ